MPLLPSLINLAIPAYVFPGDPEDVALLAASPPPGLVVMNNNSGLTPMTGDWLEQADDFRGAGIRVLGYVNTWDYGLGQPLSSGAIETAIDGVLVNGDGLLHFDGVFLDGHPRDTGPGGSGDSTWLTQYFALYAYIRTTAAGVNPDRVVTVAANAGTAVADEYLATGCSDIMCTFEGSEAAYSASWLGGNVFSYGTGLYRLGTEFTRSHFWHLIYSSAGEAQMRADVLAAFGRHAGWVYVTDAGLPNPWDVPPSWGFSPETLQAAIVGGAVPLPSAIVTCELTGHYLDMSGNPLSGTVTFTPVIDGDFEDSRDGVTLLPEPVVAQLDAEGRFTVTLPCTDNTIISPTGWAYGVEEILDGGHVSTYAISLPSTVGSPVNIAALAPVNPPGPVSTLYGVLAEPNTWEGGNTFGEPVTLDGAPQLAGPLGIGSGGTGATGQQAAITALTGPQTAGWYLRSNGTFAALGAVQPADLPAATGGAQGAVTLTGDLGGTAAAPQVTGTHLAAPLPVGQGGTGSGTQNFVDLTTAQAIAGLKTFTGEVVVPAPVNAGDAATKAYADSVAAGLSVKPAVAAATTGALPSYSYASGVITATSNGALPSIDGVAPTSGERVLVKNEVSGNAPYNGIYDVTQAGSGSAPFILTRASDMATGTQVEGAFCFVTGGTVNGGSGWTVTGAGPYTIGTTAIVWTQFAGAGTITAGPGITVTGTQVGLTGPAVAVALGGTGATSAAAALASLGAVAQGTLVFNVRDYGAKGDGTTDDTAAVQAAIAAAEAAGGGEVWFPTGQYLIGTATAGVGLTVSAPAIRFRGSGWDQTAYATTGSAIVAGSAITGTLISVTSAGSTFRMAELCVNGAGHAAYLVSVDSWNPQIVQCFLRAPAASGVHINVTSNSISPWILNNRMNGVNAAGCIGVQLDTTDGIVIGNKPANVAYGFVCLGSPNPGGTGTLFASNHPTPGTSIGVSGFWLNGPVANVALIGNRLDNHAFGAAIQISPSSVGDAAITIAGNIFYQNDIPNTTPPGGYTIPAAIQVDTSGGFGCPQLTITGNSIRSSGSNQYSALLAAAGTYNGTGCPVTSGASVIGAAGLTLAGNSVSALAFLGAGIVPAAAAANVYSANGTTWVPQTDIGAAYAPAGLTGATAPSRYAGGTTSGAPASGTWAAGDFVVDETGSFWIYDGTAWAHVAPGTASVMTSPGDMIVGGASGTPERLSGVALNVTAFGATGNGFTDDTASINAAIAALPANGGTIFFPAGNYKISSALNVLPVTATGNMVFEGVNESGGSVITQSSTTADAINGANVKGFVMRNLRLAGPGSGSGNGIHLSQSAGNPTDYVDIADVRVMNFGGDGIKLDNPIVSHLHRAVVSGCGGNAFNINGGVGGAVGTSVVLEACYGLTCGAAGFQVTSVHYSTLISCAADACGSGYVLTSCQNVTMVSPGAEQCTTAGYEISGGQEILLINPYYNAQNETTSTAIIAYWVTGSAANVKLVCPTEGGLSGAQAGNTSIKVDSGSYCTVERPSVINAVNYAGTAAAITGVREVGDVNDRFYVDTNGVLRFGGGTGATDIFFQRISGPALQASGGWQIVGALSTTPAYQAHVTGDTVQRYQVTAAGVITFGPGGSTAPDTNLYRSGVGILQTDDSLTVGGNLVVDGTTSIGTSSAASFTATGLTGATAASRYAGGVDGGPPQSGTFLTGDWIIDQDAGIIWVCTAGGSPGSWVPGNQTAAQSARYAGVTGQQPRESIPFYAATANLTAVSGVLWLSILPVYPGDLISKVGFVAGAVGSTTMTHWWTCIFTANGSTFLEQSADQGTANLAGSAAHPLTLTSPYTVPGGVFALLAGVMLAFTGTAPEIRGSSQNAAQTDASTSLFPTALQYASTSGTGLTTAPPTAPLTLAASGNLVYFGAD